MLSTCILFYRAADVLISINLTHLPLLLAVLLKLITSIFRLSRTITVYNPHTTAVSLLSIKKYAKLLRTSSRLKKTLKSCSNLDILEKARVQ